MTAPHIRDLNLGDWHEVPKGATIPTGTYLAWTEPDGSLGAAPALFALTPEHIDHDRRYFTAEPIPGPREEEVEAEAVRLLRIAHPDLSWDDFGAGVRDAFRRLAIDSLDRQAAQE